MTASSELRAAATKLRATAARPLEVIDPIHPDDPDDEWTKFYGRECPDLPPEDSPWITLMSPLLAEPLARALDLVADFWDTLDPHLDASHQHDETAVGHHLLVIARQINGGGS